MSSGYTLSRPMAQFDLYVFTLAATWKVDLKGDGPWRHKTAQRLLVAQECVNRD